MSPDGTSPVPERELEIKFSRSSGPGGQNVNKVNTKATVHWYFKSSAALTERAKARLVDRYGNQISSAGALLLSSDSTRSQSDNLADCFRKLEAIIRSVAKEPKRRKKTKPSKAAKQRRIDSKKIQAKKKAQRKKEY